MNEFEGKAKRPNSSKVSDFRGTSQPLQFGEGLAEFHSRISDWSATRGRLESSKVLHIAVPPSGRLSDLMNLILQQLDGPDLSRRPISERLVMCSSLLKKKHIGGLVFKRYPMPVARCTRSQLLEREHYHQFLKTMADRGVRLIRNDGSFRSLDAR